MSVLKLMAIDPGDTFWGVCNGVGQNNLGYLIMEIKRRAA